MSVEQNKFELAKSDRKWFDKLNKSFWTNHVDYVDHNRKEYRRSSGYLKPIEWRGLVILMAKYNLPCTLIKNHSNFYTYEFIIYDHSTFISVIPEVLLKIVPNHLMDMVAGYKPDQWNYTLNKETRLLIEITKGITQRERNLELLNFYGLPAPEDKNFWVI